MQEIEAMQAISEKFEVLSADERRRVLTWAVSKYAGADAFPASSPDLKPGTPAPHIHASPAAKSDPKTATGTAAKSKPFKKAKSIIAMDKSLNLSPAGKVSAVDFATQKLPSNAKQKCVVAVYYLRDHLELPAVSVSAVYTYFKVLGWPVPADLKNTLQQAGTEGWLDSANSEDLKLTSMGENLVEHSLPPKPKA